MTRQMDRRMEKLNSRHKNNSPKGWMGGELYGRHENNSPKTEELNGRQENNVRKGWIAQK